MKFQQKIRESIINRLFKIRIYCIDINKDKYWYWEYYIWSNHNNPFDNINSNNVTKLQYVEENINNNMLSLRGSIDQIIKNTSNSALKGKIGENLVEDIININFPDDTIEYKGNQSYEGDYHMHLKNIGTILIEVKTYSQNVPTSELTKFKRDMVRSGLKAGIFISTTSGIIGKKRYEIEKLNTEQIIIYIPNSGLEGSSIIWGILFTKNLLELDIKI